MPSWAQRGSDADNVYGDQQSEYAAYEKYLKAREDGASSEVSTPPAPSPVADTADGVTNLIMEDSAPEEHSAGPAEP